MRHVIIVFVLLAPVGCEAWQRYSADVAARASTRDVDGDIPMVEVGKQIPTLVGNPLDVNAWWEIGENLAYILLGAGGLKTGQVVREKRRKKKEGESNK